MGHSASRISVRDGNGLAAHYRSQPAPSLRDLHDDQHQQRNDARAAQAAVGILAYGSHLGGAHMRDELESLVADFISDLHHLCDAAGISFDTISRRADTYYRNEIDGRL